MISLRRRREASAPYVLAGSVLYLAGIVVTFAYHIPKNDDLALVDPNSAGAASAWNDYQTPWTAWNHVRTSRTTRPVGELAGAADLAGDGVQR